MRLAHISDLHFGHHDPAISSTLAADVAAQSPDVLVASGDFTQRGTEREFEMAHEFLETVHAPVFAVPGNHDLGKHPIRRFLDPYGLYRRYIAPEVEPYREVANGTAIVALAGLNTTRRLMLDRLSKGSASVSELARPLPMSLPAVVQHLQVLEQSGLVKTAKVGRVRTCTLDTSAMSRAEKWINDRRKGWETKLDKLGALLDSMPDL